MTHTSDKYGTVKSHPKRGNEDKYLLTKIVMELQLQENNLRTKLRQTE